MASSPGRTTEPRVVAGVGTTSSSTALTFTSGTIFPDDVGRPITGTGIQAGTTLATRTSATAGTLSQTATGTATISATLGTTPSTSNSFGFTGWSPETEAEAAVYPLPTAGAGAPSILSDAVTRVAQRNR